MYQAQIAGCFPGDKEYLGEDMAEIASKLAKEVASIMRGLEEEDQLAGEGVEISATLSAELDIPSVKKLTRTP